jgi:hypothetical protein
MYYLMIGSPLLHLPLSYLGQVRPSSSSSQKDNELTLFQKSVLVGILLGDASLRRSNPATQNTQLIFRQSLKNQRIRVSDFQNYCATSPREASSTHKRTNNTYHVIGFSTLSCPCFNYYRELFYLNGVKVVPSNIGEF